MIFNFDIFRLGKMKYTFIFSKITDPIFKVLEYSIKMICYILN